MNPSPLTAKWILEDMFDHLAVCAVEPDKWKRVELFRQFGLQVEATITALRDRLGEQGKLTEERIARVAYDGGIYGVCSWKELAHDHTDRADFLARARAVIAYIASPSKAGEPQGWQLPERRVGTQVISPNGRQYWNLHKRMWCKNDRASPEKAGDE